MNDRRVADLVSSCKSRWNHLFLQVLLVAVSVGLLAGCGGGGNSTTTQKVTPPGNLAYPQTSIAATVGVAISADTPTVSGTVSAWSIAPALPAGLALSTSNGSISGTPTQASASGSYTITASNSGGSTTATLTIAVAAAPPPPGIAYSQATITGTVGTAITADIPTITGTVGTFSISPALPLGLTLDGTTGAISGTPGTASPQTVYTVTATSAAGNVSATVTITVTQPQQTLLELGHGAQILSLRETTDRLLSEDVSGHWVLWDASAHTIIASGDGAVTTDTNQIALAGSLAAVGTASGIQVMSASDGSSVFTIPAGAAWWRLATDGSYLVTGSASGLTAWSSSGASLFTQSGNFMSAIAFAAPGQVQIANGPAAASVIQTISVPSGSSVTSAPYLGTFQSWFGDGGRFITNTASAVWIYSSAGAQQQLISLPSTNNLAGVGSWFWSTSTAMVGSTYQDALQIYQVGNSTPAATFNFPSGSTYVLSATTLASFDGDNPGQVNLIDLSGPAPVQTTATLPIPLPGVLAAASSTQWVFGNDSGALIDGSSLSGSPAFFGYGAALSIAGSPGVVTVATGSGRILSWNLSTMTQISTIGFLASKIQLTSDGSTLAAASVPYGTTLNLYAVASGATTQTFSSTSAINDFSLSANGQYLGEVLLDPSGSPYRRQVVNVASGSTLWTDTGSTDPIQFSPDGSFFGAVLGSVATNSYSTNLYNSSGDIAGAVPGFDEGWIDSGHLLAWSVGSTMAGPITTAIYSSAGAVLTTFPVGAMPAATYAEFPSAGEVYFSVTNSVQSLTDGSTLWKGPYQDGSPGAVAGSYIAYQWGHQVVLYSY